VPLSIAESPHTTIDNTYYQYARRRAIHLDPDPPPTRAAMLNPLLTFSLLHQYPRHIIIPQFPSLSTATPSVASLSFVRMDIVVQDISLPFSPLDLRLV
jgi:hypothetical protein